MKSNMYILIKLLIFFLILLLFYCVTKETPQEYLII